LLIKHSYISGLPETGSSQATSQKAFEMSEAVFKFSTFVRYVSSYLMDDKHRKEGVV